MLEQLKVQNTQRKITNLIQGQNMVSNIEKKKSNASMNQDVLIQCYKQNKATPLDCWKEVEAFKKSTIMSNQ